MSADWQCGAYTSFVRAPNTPLEKPHTKMALARAGGGWRTARPVRGDASAKIEEEMAEAAEKTAERPPLPAGHPASWGAITHGTLLDGATYPFPVFGAGGAA